MLLPILEQPPVVLSPAQNMLLLPSKPKQRHPLHKKLRLAICLVSGANYRLRGFSTDTIDIILSSWREGTQSQYQSVAKKWFEFCEKNHCDVVSTPVPLAMSFLSELFHSGLSYSYINTARSVLSSLLHVDSHIAFGQLPIVKRFMKGVFEN